MGEMYRAPYYNGNPNIGPRIIGNLDQYPCRISPRLLAWTSLHLRFRLSSSMTLVSVNSRDVASEVEGVRFPGLERPAMSPVGIHGIMETGISWTMT